MKQFFKMVFASIIGAFIALVMMTFISFFLIVGIFSGIGSTSNASYNPKSDENIFQIKLNGTISDTVEESPLETLLGGPPSLSLKDILSSIEKAKGMNGVKGIYLDLGVFSTGTANVDAIRRALIDFKESGKFIVAYADSYTQGGYYLASVADSIFLNPEGLVGLTGLASQTMFYKGLLEKIGIEMVVFKVGTYKGAVEPFMSGQLSEANREQITAYQGMIWKNITGNIANNRNISVNDINHFADEGLFFAAPMKAVECGLIDGLKYRKEVEQVLMDKSGQKGNQMKYLTVSKIKRVKKGTSDHNDKIAIIYAEGEITTESVSSPYGSRSNVITQEICKDLRKAKENDAVKAIVLRVNSPGGSAFVSDQIWKEVYDLNKEKPVVVSMGNVAASGGYYISSAASKIVAEANTLTGSIGIFGLFPNATGLFHKLALSTDGVKTNRFADLGDISRPMTEEEKALIQAYVERGYDTFLQRCADGRGMTKDEIDAIGQGRVWTGEQALQIGLVDELGGIDKALETAAGLADMDEYSVIEISSSKDFLQEILQKQMDDIKVSIAKNMIGEEMEYLKALHLIRNNSGIQARIPYDLRPL